MAKRNGGIIGPDNVPAGPLGAAKGVWRIEDAFNYQKAGLWPTVLGYQVPNSARFNSASSDELTRTFPTDGNRKTFTISYWIKRSTISTASGQSHFLVILLEQQMLLKIHFIGVVVVMINLFLVVGMQI